MPDIGTPERAIVDAALTCYAHYGVSKTTFEDVAREASCSRATVYRYFPGKQALLAGVVGAEIRRIAAHLEPEARAAGTLEDLLVTVLVRAGREFEGHDALRHVLAVEPEVVLPQVVFDGAERLFAVATAVLTPHLSRFLPPTTAIRTGEWVCRLAITYLFSPSDHVSLADEASTRRLVRTFVLPGLAVSEERELIATR